MNDGNPLFPFLDPAAQRHRETLWWGTYDTVLGRLYAHALASGGSERPPGETISDELRYTMHVIAAAAATHAHGPLIRGK